MSKMIQIRNVPDTLHGRLKSRAALQGQSLSEYLLGELQRLAALPTTEELAERIASRTPLNPRVSPTKIIRMERDRR
jgi:plasmid stability protein